MIDDEKILDEMVSEMLIIEENRKADEEKILDEAVSEMLMIEENRKSTIVS